MFRMSQKKQSLTDSLRMCALSPDSCEKAVETARTLR